MKVRIPSEDGRNWKLVEDCKKEEIESPDRRVVFSNGEVMLSERSVAELRKLHGNSIVGIWAPVKSLDS